MAKVVFKTPGPKAAYEYAEVEGGGTMSQAAQAALLDEFIQENGLVPVETTFVGETPIHKYGRYNALGVRASALPPALPSNSTGDLITANAKVSSLEAEVASLRDQLGKKQEKSGADVVEGNAMDNTIDNSTGGAQSTEAARAVLNTQDGVNIVPSGEEVREDMSIADRSDDNPKVDAPKRGRPAKADSK